MYLERPYRDIFEKLMAVRPVEIGITSRFYKRLKEGGITREENPESHFCVFAAVYNTVTKEALIGKHKKSGLWLPNGGHLDPGESLSECASREVLEELGLAIPEKSLPYPHFLTITEIDNRPVQLCREHYDVWFFVPVDNSQVDQERASTEFSETRWISTDSAASLTKDPNTLYALERLTQLLQG